MPKSSDFNDAPDNIDMTQLNCARELSASNHKNTHEVTDYKFTGWKKEEVISARGISYEDRAQFDVQYRDNNGNLTRESMSRTVSDLRNLIDEDKKRAKQGCEVNPSMVSENNRAMREIQTVTAPKPSTYIRY